MDTKLEIFSTVTDISHKFKGILLDAYGVFWAGNEIGALPGSKNAMEELVSSGKIVGILSNSSHLASSEINKFEHHGIKQGKHFHFIITSGQVTRHIFLNEKLPFDTPRKTFWLFGGTPHKNSPHKTIFQDTSYQETSNIDDADFIYVSIPHINGEDQTDPELFRNQLEEIKSKNLPMLCANPDLFGMEGTKKLVRHGSIAKMYEEMGGQVFYVGKPHNRVYQIALEEFRKLGVMNPAEILMVGDTPETDIMGARQNGMSAALITKTGIMADRISQKGEKALEELPENETPNYFIERLGN